MANTYTQIHVQFVFVVKHRYGAIQSAWKDELYKYISGIVQHHKHKLIVINGMPDHIHLLIGMRPSQSISDLIQDVKGSSSRWINEKQFVKGKFEWQDGYGAFSYSKSQLQNVINYIINQETHHQKTTFTEEYIQLLQQAEIDYKEEYLFEKLI